MTIWYRNDMLMRSVSSESLGLFSLFFEALLVAFTPASFGAAEAEVPSLFRFLVAFEAASLSQHWRHVTKSCLSGSGGGIIERHDLLVHCFGSLRIVSID